MSAEWWNEVLAQYQSSLEKDDWKAFCMACKAAKRRFFEMCIEDIAYSNKCPWDLMNWIQKCKLPAVEALSYQGTPCNTLDSLWDTLHRTYNPASGREHDLSDLESVPAAVQWDWLAFSMLELCEALSACSGKSAPGPDHVNWRHLKWMVRDGSTPNAVFFLRIMFVDLALALRIQGVPLGYHSETGQALLCYHQVVQGYCTLEHLG